MQLRRCGGTPAGNWTKQFGTMFKLFEFCQYDYRRFLIVLQDIYFTYNTKLIKSKKIIEYINCNKKKNQERYKNVTEKQTK